MDRQELRPAGPAPSAASGVTGHCPVSNDDQQQRRQLHVGHLRRRPRQGGNVPRLHDRNRQPLSSWRLRGRFAGGPHDRDTPARTVVAQGHRSQRLRKFETLSLRAARPQRQPCAQAHNPQAVMAPNGSILLFHIGKELEANCLKNCAADTPASPGAQCPRLSHAASVAVADSFDGPWTRYPYILGSSPTNPAPFICEPSPSFCRPRPQNLSNIAGVPQSPTARSFSARGAPTARSTRRGSVTRHRRPGRGRR